MPFNFTGAKSKFDDMFAGLYSVGVDSISLANLATANAWGDALNELCQTSFPQSSTLSAAVSAFKLSMMADTTGLISYLDVFAATFAPGMIGTSGTGGIVVTSIPPPVSFVLPSMAFENTDLVTTTLSSALTAWLSTGTYFTQFLIFINGPYPWS